MKFDKEKSQMYYDLWNGTGRLSVGEKTEILVNDRKLFPNEEEVEITFEIHDGFAVGDYQGREYLMLYPMMDDIKENPQWVEEIENYVGERMIDETGLQVQDVALTFGKIESSRQLPLVLDTYDTVIRLDAKVPVEKALKVINDEIRKNIISSYHLDIPKVKDLPENKNGNIKKGYLIIYADTEKPAQFISQPKTVQEMATLENIAKDEFYIFESLKQVIEKVDSRKQRNITDVQFTQGDGRNYNLTCKIDGVQMPVKQLSNRESLRVHQNIIRGMDPLTALSYPVLLKKYAEEIQAHEEKKNEGMNQKPDGYREFRKMLDMKYPEGLTLQVFGMDGKQFNNMARTLVQDTQWINPDEATTAMPTLKARIAGDEIYPDNHPEETFYTTVFVKPEMYDFVFPQWAPDSMDKGMDLLDKSVAQQFRHADSEWKNINLQIPVCLELRETMKVENVPFREAFRVYNDCGKHKVLWTDQLAQYLALDEFRQKGSKAIVQQTPLNRDVLGRLQEKFPDGKLQDERMDKDIRKEAGFIMREKGLLNPQEYNLVFSCLMTNRTAEDNAFRLTESLNKAFPYVSAYCSGNAVIVSVNTRIPKNQVTVERFIDNCKVVKDQPLVQKFQDMQDENRAMYVLGNGQILNAYVNRLATGKKNNYVIDREDKKMFLRKAMDGEIPKQSPLIASDDEIGLDKVQIHDTFRFDSDYLKVTDASLYQKRNGYGPVQWMVRCKIDGMQELGRPLSPALNKIVNNMTDGGKKAPENTQWSLMKYYAAYATYKDIVYNQNQSVNNGLKR